MTCKEKRALRSAKNLKRKQDDWAYSKGIGVTIRRMSNEYAPRAGHHVEIYGRGLKSKTNAPTSQKYRRVTIIKR